MSDSIASLPSLHARIYTRARAAVGVRSPVKKEARPMSKIKNARRGAEHRTFGIYIHTYIYTRTRGPYVYTRTHIRNPRLLSSAGDVATNLFGCPMSQKPRCPSFSLFFLYRRERRPSFCALFEAEVYV